MMKNLSRIIGAAAAAVCVAFNVPAAAQSIGQQGILTAVVVPPNSTNTFLPQPGPASVFIGTAEFANIGAELFSTPPQGSNALTGILTVRLAKSIDGTIAEAVPSVVLTVNQGTTNQMSANGTTVYGNATFANLNSTGCAGFFVVSIENTNTASTATNWINLTVFRQAPKYGAYESTARP